MMRTLALGLLVVLFAGCVGGSARTPGLQGFDDGTLVRGIVTDDELLPVAGAQVVLAEEGTSTMTDEGGFFMLPAAPGEWTIRVEAPGHESANETVHVAEGAWVDLRVQIPRLPTLRPYQVPFVLNGHYDCAHEIPIWTGDCMILYKSATGQNDTQTDETFHFRLPVNQGWESVVLELEWTQAPNNQLEGMRVYLENGNGTDVGHSYKVGRAEGPSGPLKVVVHRGEPHPRADTYPGTQTKAFIPDVGELAQVRVFPRGKFYDQTSQIRDSQGRGLLGVGVGVSIDFTVYATVFYHDRAPGSYSGIPDR